MVIDFSRKEGLVDLPGERKIHTKPVSRIGGVAIWTSTMLTFLCLVFLSYYPYGSLLSGILLGSSLMFLLGLVDDIYNLNAKFKLFIQIAIATLVYLLGVQISNIPFFGGVDLGFWSYPITILWIVGISNAVNFIDGVDGLAGSVVTVNAITLAIIAVTMSPSSPISALIGFILAGSMLAFLTYNFNPAKIFMGDSGALFSGFLLATISITGVMKTATIAILLPFVVLAVPIMDITFSSLRRISKGKSPFVADAEHIHHKLLRTGLNKIQTMAMLLCISVFMVVSNMFLVRFVNYNFVIIIDLLLWTSINVLINYFIRRHEKTSCSIFHIAYVPDASERNAVEKEKEEEENKSGI